MADRDRRTTHKQYDAWTRIPTNGQYRVLHKGSVMTIEIMAIIVRCVIATHGETAHTPLNYLKH